MKNKRFILNADDFGMSEACNTAVSEGYQAGILKSVSLVANGEAYEQAVKNVIPSCPDLGIGIHLNIIEGKALVPEQRTLIDQNGIFNNSYGQLLLKSYCLKTKEFMEELEKEFRAQIEKCINDLNAQGRKVTHIDSHVHTHAIPPIFELVCKLAKEYGISQVRTQFEHFYIIPDIFVHLSKKYFVNLIKIALLNSFTLINKQTAENYKLNTNNYLIGVGYTSMMNSLTVSCGLSAIKNKELITVEALIHPCRYEEGIIDNHFTEYRITQNQKLKEKIERLGYEITNYIDLYSNVDG